MSDFVDYNNHSCSFNSPEFIELLNQINGYSTDVIDDNDEKLLTTYILGFNAHYSTRFEQIVFGEEISYIGFPVHDETSSGSYCQLISPFAISANAVEPDGAWEFVKYILTEHQETAGGSLGSLQGLPIKISKLKSLAEEAKGKEGHQLSYDIDGVDVPVDFPNDEDNLKRFDLIYSLTRLSGFNEEMYNLIYVEIDDFFNGTKSAEETADIIQNKISTYLNEHS